MKRAVFADAVETTPNTQRLAVWRRGGILTLKNTYNEKINEVTLWKDAA